MYNLLMSGAGWGPSQGTMEAARVFEYTTLDLQAHFKPNNVLHIQALAQWPALFTPEIGPDALGVARVGRVLQATLQYSARGVQEYRIDYIFDPDVAPIPLAQIKERAQELGLEPKNFGLSRTHWAIKNIDLFQLLHRWGLGHHPKPTLFNIGDGTVDANLVAVMMPFAGFDKTAKALQDACQMAEMVYTRVDDYWVNSQIVQDVVSLISRAKVVICDLTDKNPNVFYELGLAHMLGKEVIMVAQNRSDVPFDVAHLRFIPYLGNDEGRAGLTNDVARRLVGLKSRT